MANSLYDFALSEATSSTTGGVNTAEGQNPSTVNDAMRAWKQLEAAWLDDLAGVNTVGGTATAVTVTAAQGFTAYGTGAGQIGNGTVLALKMTAAATGAATLNVNGIGTKKIRRQGDSAIQANDWLSGGIYLFRYDTAYDTAAGAWVLMNPASDGVLAAYLPLAGGKTVTGGFNVTPNNLGNITSFTIDPSLGNYQYGTNHGAATWTAPASDCAVDILVTNDATAGTITFSGFTVGSSTGSTLTTTNTNKFLISIRRINGISTYSIYALQ